jgi:alpha-L-fucosidase 2
MKKLLTGMLLASAFLSVAGESSAGQEDGVVNRGGSTMDNLKKYEVVWDSPSKDCNGSTPLGNGETGLNVWMEENGDLCFYISRTDTWDDNARLLKVGKVRVSLAPNPLVAGAKFRQTLSLRTGEIVIEITGPEKAGAAASKTLLRVWVDANHPVIHVTTESSEPLTATARIELWRKEPYQLPSVEICDVLTELGKPGNNHEPTIVEPDTVLTNQKDRVGWFHHNKKSVGFDLTMRIQGLSDYKMEDPILHRTFGAVIAARGGKRVDDLTLTTAPDKSQRIAVYVLTKHPSTPEEWLKAMDKEIASVESVSFEKRRAAHEKWWGDFWDRSWIFASEEKPAAQGSAGSESAAFDVTRGYVLQRFINACDGRGQYPIKFNGATFTVPFEDRPGDADYRLWGGPGYWWQNTRLAYEGMCTAGDFDQMQPLFRMYAGDVYELSKYRTKHYFGFDGVYYPECIYTWGAVFSETYGWQPFEERGEDKLQTNGCHKWAWVGGLEFICLMLDYYDHTGDEKFLREKALPIAHDYLKFFDGFYKVGPNGKLVMHPAQAVETWWDCTNPMTEVAGLRAVTERLLALPENVASADERAYWKAFRERTPEIPTREENGVRMLAVADKFAQKCNCENPELYAVFPFRQICIGKPGLELGIEALKNRGDKGDFGWRQDDIFMAYLGLTDQAKEYVTGRARNSNKESRFPAFWGPNYDWTPDQTHGGVLMKAFQAMLMQTDGRTIYLLPAWPKDWNADFKLHAPYKTIVQGQVRNGKIENLKVEPAERTKDVKILAKP